MAEEIRRATVFAPDNESGWDFLRRLEVPARVESVCFLGARVFVGGTSTTAPGIIHEVAPGGGAFVQSFGDVYRTSLPLVREHYAMGSLACIEDAEEAQVVFAPHALPEVHAFSSEGARAWIARLPDWQSPALLESPDRRRVGPDPRNVRQIDLVSDLSAGPDGSVIVQVRSRVAIDLEAGEWDYSLRSFVLDGTDGQGTMLMEPSLGRVLTFDSRFGLVTLREDPVPRVTMWR